MFWSLGCNIHVWLENFQGVHLNPLLSSWISIHKYYPTLHAFVCVLITLILNPSTGYILLPSWTISTYAKNLYVARTLQKYCYVRVGSTKSSASFWRIWHVCVNIFRESEQHSRKLYACTHWWEIAFILNHKTHSKSLCCSGLIKNVIRCMLDPTKVVHIWRIWHGCVKTFRESEQHSRKAYACVRVLVRLILYPLAENCFLFKP